MKLRDSHATLSNDKTEYVMPSGGVQIIADDGRTLFDITLNKDGTIRVGAGHVCKHNGELLDDRILIHPIASNCVNLVRPIYPVRNEM